MRLLAVLVLLAGVLAAPAEAQPRKSHAIDVLARNGAAVGFITNSLAAPGTYEALREVPGLDWVFIDMEHGPFDPSKVRDIVAAFRRADGSFPVTPMFRIPANCSEVDKNQWVFKQVLDGGAFGVIVPHCDEHKDVEAGAQAMRYPPFVNDPAPKPRGVRGAGGAPASWGLTFAQYVQVADLWPLDPRGELLYVPMVESKSVIQKLHSVLQVPGIGALFIGPSDLHSDMGYAGQSGVPEVEEQIQRALAQALRAGVAIGITTSAADAQQRLDQGFRFITIGAASPAALAVIIAGLRR